jgi:hypothetical protein
MPAASAASISTALPPSWRHPTSPDTPQVLGLAVCLVVEDDSPSAAARWYLWLDHRVCGLSATRQHRVDAGGHQPVQPTETGCQAWAVANCSRGLAADELSDGPFGVVSIVTYRPYERLAGHILGHDTTYTDSTTFFRHCQSALGPNGVRGHITGSANSRWGEINALSTMRHNYAAS